MSFPGVPSLSGSQTTSPIQLLSSDAIALTGQLTTTWGLYYNGQPVVQPDSVVSFEYKQDMRIPTYPQEQGAFQSYNKVLMPYDIRLEMSKGGSASDRQTFINSIQSALESLNLYSVVVPEITYPAANVVHYEISRTAAKGMTLITAMLWLTLVRSTSAAPSSAAPNPSNPSGAAFVTGGTAFPTAPTTAQASAALMGQ